MVNFVIKAMECFFVLTVVPHVFDQVFYHYFEFKIYTRIVFGLFISSIILVNYWKYVLMYKFAEELKVNFILSKGQIDMFERLYDSLVVNRVNCCQSESESEDSESSDNELNSVNTHHPNQGC